ncbi:rRNA adenine N-6-methyltransferase family protein [Geoglobus acetivorans]|uniref:Methyltransferase domain-containing protein n=1 Tax=Geoglobus acetivorans TaxID=565033 RepID=A0ABZ3H674_GEOAI|nr:methyltransferase domain-containing protein [Geoglobus acetivorans]
MENKLNYGKFTKDEIIGIVFSKLMPGKRWVFADIGSGTGKVAEFFSRYVHKVYAVEVDGELASRLEKKFRGTNVEVINSDGYDFLREHDVDGVFFGGTKGIERMIDVCRANRIAVNCARIDVALRVAEKLRENGMFEEIVFANISKSYELVGGLAFKSYNPVFVVVGHALRS